MGGGGVVGGMHGGGHGRVGRPAWTAASVAAWVAARTAASLAAWVAAWTASLAASPAAAWLASPAAVAASVSGSTGPVHWPLAIWSRRLRSGRLPQPRYSSSPRPLALASPANAACSVSAGPVPCTIASSRARRLAARASSTIRHRVSSGPGSSRTAPALASRAR